MDAHKYFPYILMKSLISMKPNGMLWLRRLHMWPLNLETSMS